MTSRDRNTVIVAVCVGLVLVGLAVSVPFGVGLLREWTTPPEPSLAEVRIYEDLRTDHTGKEVEYDPAPPPGGPHDPVWLDCGFYDRPVRDENAVHALEHGAVWITYDPDLSESDVRSLARRLPEEGILSPYPGQDAPVILTVWERQLYLDSADDPRIPLFLEEYGDGHTAPEPLASCEGGQRVFDDEGSGAPVKV